jgi:hypothetical protein
MIWYIIGFVLLLLVVISGLIIIFEKDIEEE